MKVELDTIPLSKLCKVTKTINNVNHDIDIGFDKYLPSSSISDKDHLINNKNGWYLPVELDTTSSVWDHYSREKWRTRIKMLLKEGIIEKAEIPSAKGYFRYKLAIKTIYKGQNIVDLKQYVSFRFKINRKPKEHQIYMLSNLPNGWFTTRDLGSEDGRILSHCEKSVWLSRFKKLEKLGIIEKSKKNIDNERYCLIYRLNPEFKTEKYCDLKQYINYFYSINTDK